MICSCRARPDDADRPHGYSSEVPFLRAATVLATAAGVVAIAAACGTDDGTALPVSRTVETTVLTITESTTDAPSTAMSADPATNGYRPALVRTEGRQETTSFDVLLPQVQGGDPAVRARFNSGMRTALDDVVTGLSDVTVSDGELVGDERSRVTTVTDGVVAGALVVTTYARGAAHPNNHVATITIDARTAQPILLDDVFVDPEAAAAQLAAVVTQIDPRADPVSADIGNFLNWVPLTDGFHTYVPVVHALGDWLPITVPWSELSPLMRPGMADQLSG